MLVHRARRNTENIGDILVGLATRDPEQHLGLAGAYGELALQKRLLLPAAGFGEAVEQLPGANPPDQAEAEPALPCLHLQCCRQAEPGHGETRQRVRQAALGLGGAPEQSPRLVRRQQKAARRIQRRAGAQGGAGIAQMHAHARQQLVDHDGLGDIIHPARLQPAHHMRGVGQAGHEDHRDGAQRRHGFQGAAGVEPVQPRHHRVQQYQVRGDMAQRLQRRLAAGGHQRGEPRCFQRIGQQPEGFGRVVHHQNQVAAGVHGAVSGRSSSQASMRFSSKPRSQPVSRAQNGAKAGSASSSALNRASSPRT